MPNDVKPHETWGVLDSSKAKEYLTCPRKYFFKYVLGWRQGTKSHHLTFGTAWHAAMEQLLLGGYSEQNAMLAYTKFMLEYRKESPPDLDLSNAPKNPAFALKAIQSYCANYRSDKFKVRFTEVAGTVPVSEGTSTNAPRMLHFRLDSMIENMENFGVEGVGCLEHKTASQNSRQWADQWKLSVQVGTYLHVLGCIYEPTEISGVTINGAVFTKGKGCEFVRLPLKRSTELMGAWLWNINDLIDQLTNDFDRLMTRCDDSDPVLRAFPMNTESCTKYFGCEFLDFCCSWANPLRQVAQPPVGVDIDFWDPRKHETPPKFVYDGTLGAEPTPYVAPTVPEGETK